MAQLQLARAAALTCCAAAALAACSTGAGPQESPSASASPSAAKASASSQAPSPSSSASRATGSATKSASPTTRATSATSSPTPTATHTSTKPVSGVPAGTTTWRVPSGSDATAAVVVRKGDKVCWAIAEYEGTGFTGTATGTADGDQLSGTEWGLNERSAAFVAVSNDGSLQIVRTSPESGNWTWTQASPAQARDLIAAHIDGADGALLYSQIADTAAGNCS